MICAFYTSKDEYIKGKSKQIKQRLAKYTTDVFRKIKHRIFHSYIKTIAYARAIFITLFYFVVALHRLVITSGSIYMKYQIPKVI